MTSAQLSLGGVVDKDSGAIFSSDGCHRFLLWRRWPGGPGGVPLWIGAKDRKSVV